MSSGKTLILCPLKLEYKYLVEGLVSAGLAVDFTDEGNELRSKLRGHEVVLAWGAHGKVQFALETQHLIRTLGQVESVICAGCAGALVPELKIGDVVVAEKTVEHDFHVRFGKPEVPSFPAGLEIPPEARKSSSPEYSVHYGPVASGDEDIVSPERAQSLHQQTKALCVAWEGAGGARASAFCDVPFVEVRGVTDNCNSATESDFVTNLSMAMSNVALWLKTYLVDCKGPIVLVD